MSVPRRLDEWEASLLAQSCMLLLVCFAVLGASYQVAEALDRVGCVAAGYEYEECYEH